VVDAAMDVLFVGDDALQKLGISTQHAAKCCFRGSKGCCFACSEDSCLNETFNEDDDEVPIGERNGHKLLEAPENLVLRASKRLSETQGKALRDLVFEFRDIWRARLSADGPTKVTPLKIVSFGSTDHRVIIHAVVQGYTKFGVTNALTSRTSHGSSPTLSRSSP
jgi:hypothetical protein